MPLRANDFELVRDQVWLAAYEDPDLDLTQSQLAAKVGMSQGQVSRRLKRARANRLSPAEMYDIAWITLDGNPFKVDGCACHYLIRIGELIGCLMCGITGMDHATPFYGVTPLPLDLKPKSTKEKPKTRRQKRRELSRARS